MDRRDRNHDWYTFDERSMTLSVGDADEGQGIPARFEVCGTCDGRGEHVNPSIDAHGLSREDFDEDPDFRENYFSGMYDVPCNECHGRRVVPVVDEFRATATQVKYVNDWVDDLREMEAEMEAERRMGA